VQPLQRYRTRALWATGLVGATVAAFGPGASFPVWGFAFPAIVAVGAAIGALLAYLFFQFFVAHILGARVHGDGAPIAGGGEPAVLGDSGGNGGGDGGGDG
jgi:hypothetical protein